MNYCSVAYQQPKAQALDEDCNGQVSMSELVALAKERFL